jgi:putative flippase GtrA
MRYGVFALLAMAVNIGSQAAFMAVYVGHYSIELSILLGTTLGLLAKYVLDKKYIFCFKAQSVAHDSQRFLLYAVMGLVTTVVFWGSEYLFQLVFATNVMRYVGGAIGLVIGYLIKYRLDKRFVFNQVEAQR